MENISYAKAYTEVLEILKYIPKKDYNRIPQQKIQHYNESKDRDYIFTVNKDIKLDEQKISKKAKAIIVMLYRDYMVDKDKKEKINELLKLNARKNELRKSAQYSSEVVFRNSEQQKEEVVALVKIDEIKWYQKIFNKIKCLLLK